MLIAKLASFMRETLTDAARVTSSREGLKSLYGVSLYRNVFYLMLNSAIGSILGFVFWALAARLYTTDAVGFASATISAAALLAVLSTLGLGYGLIRFLPHAGEKATPLINSCFTIGGVISIALALIFLAGLGFWSPALLPIREHPIFLIAFVIFTAALTLSSFAQDTFVAKRSGSFVLAQGLIFGILRLIPLVLLVTTFQSFGIFASWVIAVSIASAAAIFSFLPHLQADYRPQPAFRREVVNEMLHFSLSNYVANLLWSIPSFVLPLMVLNFLGAESNAYFYIGWAVGNILLMVPQVTSLSLFAEGSDNAKRLWQGVRSSLKLIFIILIPAIIVIFLVGDKILLLFGEAYAENATKLLWVLAISALPLSLNQVYFAVKRVQLRMRRVIELSALSMITILALSYFLLPQMGILGAGLAWLAGRSIGLPFIIFEFRGSRWFK